MNLLLLDSFIHIYNHHLQLTRYTLPSTSNVHWKQLAVSRLYNGNKTITGFVLGVDKGEVMCVSLCGSRTSTSSSSSIKAERACNVDFDANVL